MESTLRQVLCFHNLGGCKTAQVLNLVFPPFLPEDFALRNASAPWGHYQKQ